jgi:RHS repeat-associated protein
VVRCIWNGERDSESSLDHTLFRQYSSSLARWMHPDPAGLAAVDPSNPQSWNRYSYVTNNPLALIDPSGLDECAPGEHDCNWGLDQGNPGQDIQGAPPVPIDFGNFWDNQSHVGIGGGGGQFDLVQRAFTPTDYLLQTDTSPGCLYYFDDNACARDVWVPVYGNWNLLNLIQWNWDQAHLGRDGRIILGKQPGPNFEANQQCQAEFLTGQYGTGSTSFVKHFSLFNTFSKEGGITTLLLEGGKLTVGALAVRAGATTGEVAGVFLVPTGLGTAYDAQARFVCRNVSGSQGHD